MERQVFDTYEAAGYTGMQYRLLFQPTITSRDKHGNIVQTLGPYYVGCVDYEEKKSRKIRPIPRPKSAPVNIRKDQRVSRERLSVPSQFQKLGNQFLDKKQEEMEASDDPDKAFRNWYYGGVLSYEAFKNGENYEIPEECLPASRKGPETTLESVRTDDVGQTGVGPHFWPQVTFENYFKESVFF